MDDLPQFYGISPNEKTPRKSKLREHREIRDDEGLLIRHFAGSNTNFVRCIKPNSKMEPNKFEGAMILSQLKCAGMTRVLKLMQEGCPSRVSFAELYKTYEKILPSKIVRLDPHLFARPGKFAEFDQKVRGDSQIDENFKDASARARSSGKFSQKVQIWLLHVQWKKVQYGVFSCIKFRNKILWRTAQLTKIQSALRGYLARKIHRPRLHLYHRTNMLWERIMELEKMLEYLSSASQSEWSSVIKGINIETEQLLKDIKISNDKLLHNLKNYYKRILQKIDSTYFSLRQHLAKDEQRKIEQMEEKQRSEANKEEKRSLKKQKSEQQCIERAEFEERRKRKEKKYHRQQEMLRTQNENEKDIKCQRNKKLKQEKLDDEFARLARKGSTVQMIGDNIALNFIAFDANFKKKLDLWYSSQKGRTMCLKRDGTLELGLANSIIFAFGNRRSRRRRYYRTGEVLDTDLLLSCKEEFYRRLQIYQQWKELNESSIAERQINRIPMTMLASNNKGFSSPSSQNSRTIQRYFKVPFAKPDYEYINVHGGMWYAHFDGQWIARQMELYSNKKPTLLIAGQDDMEMCELPLDATQLTRKKGAEITAVEFETLWYQCGGPEYHICFKDKRN
ncbi:putative Unconventional myosin-VI [Dirofilaria immitis]|nr:putative Unconventional myosin-VI [Dirofilaria immitis]